MIEGNLDEILDSLNAQPIMYNGHGEWIGYEILNFGLYSLCSYPEEEEQLLPSAWCCLWDRDFAVVEGEIVSLPHKSAPIGSHP